METFSDRAISVRENGEFLVEVRILAPTIKVRIYERGPFRKYVTGAYVRETIARKLAEAEKLLPRGLHLMVRSAYRSRQMQEWALENAYRIFRKENPDLTEQQWRQKARNFVRDPNESQYTPGHMTAGAVDVNLADERGYLLPMRSHKIPRELQAVTVFAGLPAYMLRRRQILINAMVEVGFANAPHEWWHWSWGDAWWALRTGQREACFAEVSWERFLQETGQG